MPYLKPFDWTIIKHPRLFGIDNAFKIVKVILKKPVYELDHLFCNISFTASASNNLTPKNNFL